jgi:hypothetical protein
MDMYNLHSAMYMCVRQFIMSSFNPDCDYVVKLLISYIIFLVMFIFIYILFMYEIVKLCNNLSNSYGA